MNFQSSRSIAHDFSQGKKSNNKITIRPERSPPSQRIAKAVRGLMKHYSKCKRNSGQSPVIHLKSLPYLAGKRDSDERVIGNR
jgi:hypothetical protein